MGCTSVRSISLARLLKEIIGCSHVLSRERFVEQVVTHYSSKSEGAAHSEFDRLVGSGADHINSDTVQAELADLYERTKGIKEYTNKRVAHFDAKGPKDSPIVLEIHDVLDSPPRIAGQVHGPAAVGKICRATISRTTITG